MQRVKVEHLIPAYLEPRSEGSFHRKIKPQLLTLRYFRFSGKYEISLFWSSEADFIFQFCPCFMLCDVKIAHISGNWAKPDGVHLASELQVRCRKILA